MHLLHATMLVKLVMISASFTKFMERATAVHRRLFYEVAYKPKLYSIDQMGIMD